MKKLHFNWRKPKQVLSVAAALLLLQSTTSFAQISYTQGWESSGLNSWTTSGNGSFSRNTTTPCVGNASARANNYYGLTSNLVSPALTGTNGGDLTVSFAYKVTDFADNTVGASSADFGNVSLQWSTGPGGPWTTVYTIDNTTHVVSASCATKTTSFSGLPATGDIYLRFTATSGNSNSDNYVYFDNVSVSQGAAPSCLVPAGLSSSNTTNNSATISWTAPPVAPANGYEYYVSQTNTAPTAATVATGATGAGVTTANLGGSLTTNTQYYYWVRSVCSTSDKSAWSSSATFMTQVLVPRPWSEGFEGTVYPGYAFGGTATWYVGTTTGISGNPGSAIFANIYGSTYNNISLTTHNVGPITAADSLTFDFKNALYDLSIPPSTTSGYIKVYLSSNWGATFTQIDSFNLLATSNWTKKAYSLSSYAGQNVRVKIEGYRTAEDLNIAFDNMFIGSCHLPASPIVSGVTAYEATVAWTAPGNAPANGYSYYYSTTNTPPSPTAAPSGLVPTGTSATIGSLTPATTYYTWIRSKCSATDSSAWMGPVSFTTLCVPFSLPFNEDFSGTNFPPNCWEQYSGELGNPSVLTPGSTLWVQDDWLNVTTPTNKAAKINLYYNDRRGWLVTPQINLGPAPGNVLSFDVGIVTWNTSTPQPLPGDDSVVVLISKDGGTTWSNTNALLTLTNSNGILGADGSNSYQITLSDTGLVRFAFFGTDGTIDNTEDNDIMIDNVSITAPPCIAPVVALGNDTTICAGVTLTLNAGTQPGSATILWSDNSTGNTLDVTTTGTYHVTVTNGTCVTSDTIVVSVAALPIVDLGPDSANCDGGPIALNAGGTTNYTYMWSNNTTAQTLSATASGTYWVAVTNAAGCTATDTVELIIGEEPSIGGINVSGTPPTFNFTAEDPENVDQYSWNFGDNSQGSSVQDPSHTYTPASTTQTYTVTLVVSSDCGSDTVTTSVIVPGTSVKDLQLNADALKMYPNPTANKVTLENASQFKMKQVSITNVLGQRVAAMPIFGNIQTIDISNLTSGLYHVKIEFEEGTVVRKLEVLK